MKLTTTLEPRGAVGALVLTDAQIAELGQGQKEFPVRVTFHGTRLSLRVLRLRGENLICLAKADRQQANIEIGVAAEVEIEFDTGEQTSEVAPSTSENVAGDASTVVAPPTDPEAPEHVGSLALIVGLTID